jgi:hypothetical protein
MQSAGIDHLMAISANPRLSANPRQSLAFYTGQICMRLANQDAAPGVRARLQVFARWVWAVQPRSRGAGRE